MRKGMLGAAAAMATLIGCSTVPVTEETARPVPPDRIYKAERLAPSPDRSAQIYIMRDKGFHGSACTHAISLNNEKVMDIRQSEAATLYVSPGSYFVKLDTGGGACPNISTSQNLTINAGERQVYRILLPSDGNLRQTREQ
ncbi:hypothetical protein [Stenotrophomonas sp. Sm0581]|uniref:hypothetical protein n=1 Tax=Stenotrophomonas sp. Sm0581 TaxID=3002749 RepID=UPI0027E491BE|nr:hypothetical protein [Stenotrophomonas sp. Sm0581]MDQ7301708.1 hypothetical protein [Stenotrophomonas sp. Sm0581]